VGAGVVLVMTAAGVAILVSAVAAHPAAARPTTETGYSSSGSHKTSSDGGSDGGSDSGSDGGEAATADDSATATGSAGASGTSATAFVQVVGQVQKPGLYELPAGDRIVDAVAAAGGFTAGADQSSLNLAQVIVDGQQLVVAAQGAAPAPGPTSAGANSSSIVDINTADATAIETLDGIGPALAARILAYRTAHGGFRSVGDLQNVTGIGPKKFAAIKASVST